MRVSPQPGTERGLGGRPCTGEPAPFWAETQPLSEPSSRTKAPGPAPHSTSLGAWVTRSLSACSAAPGIQGLKRSFLAAAVHCKSQETRYRGQGGKPHRQQPAYYPSKVPRALAWMARDPTTRPRLLGPASRVLWTERARPARPASCTPQAGKVSAGMASSRLGWGQQEPSLQGSDSVSGNKVPSLQRATPQNQAPLTGCARWPVPGRTGGAKPGQGSGERPHRVTRRGAQAEPQECTAKAGGRVHTPSPARSREGAPEAQGTASTGSAPSRAGQRPGQACACNERG